MHKIDCLEDYGRIWACCEYDMLDYYENFIVFGIKYKIDDIVLDKYRVKLNNQDYDELDLANLGDMILTKITDLLIDDWNETVEV